MQRVLTRGLAFLIGVTGAVTLTFSGTAQADLAVSARCADIPLSGQYDRAAAAAALPTFVGADQICVLQALLATIGSLPGSRVVDGRYDRQTRNALKTFQLSKALPGNGLVTPDTLTALADSALEEIYANEDPIEAAAATVAEVASALETPGETELDATSNTAVEPTISERLAALKLTAPTAAPVLNLAPAGRTIELPALTSITELATTPQADATPSPDPAAAPAAAPVLSSVSDGEGGTISRATSTVVVTAEDAESAGTMIEEEPALITTTTTTTTSTTTTAIVSNDDAGLETAREAEPRSTSSGFKLDPLANSTVTDFVEPSICHAPGSVQDRDLIRNLSRLPQATCLRTFVGAGNLPYRAYSLEVLADGPTLVVLHDGEDATFDAAITALNEFGGRLVVLQSAENTRTTVLGANPEIMIVSPSSNSGCQWSDDERPLAFALHDYVVAGSKPILLLRRNETRQSVLDRFSDGTVRFELSAMGPVRELFDPLVEPLASQAFAELMVTSSSRRSPQTRAIIRSGIEVGLPVALTLVDALGMRDQCAIEALSLQTDLPVLRVLLGRAQGEPATRIISTAIRAVGLRENAQIAEARASNPARALGAEGEIPASVLALAAGGLDLQLETDVTDDADLAELRTIASALAPGLPPLPLGRPPEYEDSLFADTVISTDEATINRVSAGIAVGTGIDALAPVAIGGDDGFVVTAEVVGNSDNFIVEESVGPVLALPPRPILRPFADIAYRLVPDGTDPVLAMEGEQYYVGTGVNSGTTITTGTVYTIDGQVYDPNAQPRVISSRTIQTTVPTNPYVVPSSQTDYNANTSTIYTQQQPQSGNASGVSGPLYGSGQNTLAVPQPPSNETIIINNSIY